MMLLLFTPELHLRDFKQPLMDTLSVVRVEPVTFCSRTENRDAVSPDRQTGVFEVR